MRVELSSWETTRLSIPSTSHGRVVVVGKRTIEDASLEESQILQYECRPGVRFFPKDDGDNLPCISVVFDVGNDRFVGVQGDTNRRLISWSASSTPENAVHTTLDQPILSLAPLPDCGEGRSIVYGTLGNYDLFIASCDTNGFNVQRFSSSLLNPNLRHVGTVAVLYTEHESGSKKRKQLNECSFLYQIFADKRQFIVVRHRLSGLQSSEFKHTERIEQFVPLQRNGNFPEADIEFSNLLGIVRNGDLAVLNFRIGGELFVACLSLRPNVSIQSSFQMPMETKSMALGHENGLIAHVGTHLCLFDIRQRALLARYSLNDIFPDVKENTSLEVVGDATNSRIFMLSEESKESCCIRMCSLFSTSRLRLADAISTAHGNGLVRPNYMASSFLSQEPDNTHSKVEKQKQFDQAVEILHSARSAIMTSRKGKKVPRDFLVDKVLEASNVILGQDKNPQNGETSAPLVNGKANGSRRSVTPKNGTHHAKKSPSQNQSSGNKAIAIGTVFSKLPSSFLDEVAVLVANLVVASDANQAVVPYLDNACEIFREILQTKKINARMLLRDENENANLVARLCKSLKAYNDDKKTPKYSTMEFIFDMIRLCQDVSESQLVQFMHHILFSETPSNIAMYVRSATHLDVDDGSMSTCNQFLELNNSKDDDEGSLLSARVLVMGVSLLIREIVSYSSLNGSLLRRGFTETFSRQELFMLMRLFPKFIASLGLSKRLLELLNAVCDCIYSMEQLSEEEASAISALEEVVANEAAFSESLLPYDVALRDFKVTPAEEKKDSVQVLDLLNAPPVSPYQIERLIL